MQRLSPFLKTLFWAAFLFAYAMAVIPSQQAVSLSPSDKVNHMIAFATLALLAGLAWPGLAWWKIAFGLVAFGALIEVTQAIPALHRDASWLDLVADAAALLVGILVARSITRFAVARGIG